MIDEALWPSRTRSRVIRATRSEDEGGRIRRVSGRRPSCSVSMESDREVGVWSSSDQQMCSVGRGCGADIRGNTVMEKTPWLSGVTVPGSSSPWTSCSLSVSADSTGSKSFRASVDALSDGLGGAFESSERKRSFAAYKTPMTVRQRYTSRTQPQTAASWRSTHPRAHVR